MMKCKIVQDEGIICIFLVLLAAIDCSFVGESSQTVQALCSSNRYIYNLEPDESHQLKLTSANSTSPINKWYHKSKRRCFKEFKTNNGASHFSVVVSNMSIPSCSEKCHCNYLEIAEPRHNEKFCGINKDQLYFESKSGYLSIEFHQSMQFEVTLTFAVKRNTYIITGLPKEGFRSGHFLETPYFPQLYQFDYIAEYVMQSNDLSGHVMLMFLDFEIAPESFIEVVGHNGTHPARYFGDTFRPPVLVSQKHQLNLRFEANYQVKSGFRAVSFFLRDADLQTSKPYTKCGGSKDGFGGSLTVDFHADHDYYDCLWHLFPPVLTFVEKSYFLSVSNITLENIGPNASLEFREGLNSKSKLVKSIDCNNSNCSIIPTEVSLPAAGGLYIRFNGRLKPHSVFKMIYGTYRNGNCSATEVLCNERCLLPALRCDGIEHCFDGRDEQKCTTISSVLPTTSRPTIEKRKLNIENTLASFLVVLSIGICGLVVFVLVIIVALYRHFKIVPSAAELTEQLQAREMAGPMPGVCSRIASCFDQPPSYDDFIQSSDCYPPLLYSRAGKRNSEPYCNQHTTSFCGKDVLRHHSIHSFNPNLSPTISENNSSEDSSLFPEPSCSFGRNNVEWTFDSSNQRKPSSSLLKRSTSHDSKLNKESDSDNCHVHLSITHSMAPQTCFTKHHTLPTDFKINELKPNEINITFQTVLPEIQCTQERRYSSCVFCHDSLTLRSEIMTTIKARCFSDPCKTSTI